MIARVAGGTFRMPDHELPAMVELQLSVTSGGITSTTTRIIDFTATELTVESQPAGVLLSAGTHVAAAPFTDLAATLGATSVPVSVVTGALVSGRVSAVISNLGNIAMRLGKKKLRWDPVKERILDDDEASKMLSREYRKPWVLG